MDLDSLTNKQLRQKCLEYNLPNVPITDSNRKILIKRLNAAMTGVAPKKPTTPKTSTPTNRRKTVHATITTTVSSGDEDDFVIKTQRTNNVAAETRRRQTVAPAPVSVSPPKPRPTAPKLNNNERIVPIGFESVANSTRISEAKSTTTLPNRTQDDRQRRSVSLSKTGVLTTSYSTETAPLRTTYEREMEEDEYDEPEEDLDDVEMENVEVNETPKVYTHPVYSGYNQSSYTVPIYNSPTFLKPTTPPAATSTTTNKLYPDLNSSGLQNDYYNSFDGMRASHSSSSTRHTNLGFTHNTPTSYVPTSPQLSSNTSYRSGGALSSAPIYHSDLGSSTKRYTTGSITKRHTARAIDNDDLAASSSDDQYEAPYLSKFSRNLENIQPEPIYKRSVYTPVIKKRRGTYGENEDGTLTQLWTTLEQKYHLKTVFYCILCFFLAVFIYVFFLQ